MDNLQDKFKEIADEILKKYDSQKTFEEMKNQNKCTSNKCEDQFVAIIEISNAKVDFIKDDIKNNARHSEQQNYENNKLDTIALILESPHKKEFEQNGNYIGPAMGATGDNIERYLLGNLAKYMHVNDLKENGAYFVGSKIKSGKYRLILVNAVQYQCSLGNLKGEKSKNRRDDIFTGMFENGQEDFIDRVKKYNPKIIINCCTKGIKNLQQQVQKVIDCKFPNALKLIGFHPASNLFTCGFWDA